MDDLITIQKGLEQEANDEAKRRMTADNQKAYDRGMWSESKMGRAYTKSASSAFVEAVQNFMNPDRLEKGGRHNRAVEALLSTGIEPDVIAYLFTKGVFNRMALSHRRRTKRVSLCVHAADLIHDEWRIRHFADDKVRKGILNALFRDFQKRDYPRDWRKRTIIRYFHAEQLEWSGWSTREKLMVGYALLVLFRDATGLVDAPKESQFVDPTPALLADFQTNSERRVLDYMLYTPMVVKPLPWTEETLFRGGYISTSQIRRYPIIKGARKRDLQRFDSFRWDEVLPAVNAIQETGWRVNKTVLETLEWAMYDRAGSVGGLPPSDDLPLPPTPVGYRDDEEITKAHNKACFLVHSTNRENISKRLMVLATITMAQKYKRFRAVYFPHNLDSRGRAYPLPAFLNPQGPDHTKALLEFSEGKPIDTEDQAAWLAIAGANAYGNDKISLQDRVYWVQDNEDMVFAIATSPTSDLRWLEASDPWQFLRFCLEWKAFWDHGFGYVSHMVVPVDATCSGLQHYSAMLRDEVGGRSVNLVPGLTRQDIYQDVADKVIEYLVADGSDRAVDWIKFGVNRKMTKRQVMVVPYAGTFVSCLSYTKDAVMERLKEGHTVPWGATDGEDHRDRCVYLAQLIWRAIDETVVKGKEAMKWISDATREYTRWANKQPGSPYSKAMNWVTPDGFCVIHWRPDETKQRLETYLDGRVVLTYYDPTERLSPGDMALAVAPNFVHSMDACHLRMAVVRGVSMGLTSFGMIHDSFGVHAADMSAFVETCVKPAFIEMYQNDVLASFAGTLPDAVTPPELPLMGTLDLEAVQHSEFFFS